MFDFSQLSCIKNLKYNRVDSCNTFIEPAIDDKIKYVIISKNYKIIPRISFWHPFCYSNGQYFKKGGNTV